MPDIVAPVVTEAYVDREGQIQPQRNTVARDLLTPLPSDDFSIGAVADLDDFLTVEPLRLPKPGDWQAYLAHCRKMLDAVSRGWPEGDANYRHAKYGLIEAAQDGAATIRNIFDLYDKLIADKHKSPLLSQMISPSTGRLRDQGGEQDLARRLGHSNPHFPLAMEQRQVLACLDAAGPGEVIAVNGPPGTGKTTMLLSAVAGLWVSAALKGGAPPIIVAASSNNQAVTNIIDAFGNDFGKGEGPFAGRWLSGVESFGIYLPASTRRQEAAEKYQTEDFQVRMETVDGFRAAKEAWLTAARAASPGLQGDVAEAVANLHSILPLSRRVHIRLTPPSGRTSAVPIGTRVARPAVSAPLAEAETGASRATVLQNLDLFSSRGLVRAIAEQERCRVWVAKE